MQLLFAGTPATAVPALEALLTSSHDVVAVLTRPPAQAGRGRRLVSSPVMLRAAAAGIEILTPPGPRDPAFLDRLVALAPDCAPVVAYGALLPPDVLDVPPWGWVNLHFSVLPAWRGAAPVQHAILAGDALTGATTFRLVAEMDAGPVFATVTEAVRPTDTAGSLLERLARAGADLLLSTLDHLEAGELQPRPQPSENVSYAPKLRSDDARVRWEAPAFAVDRRVRACSPAPGAWTWYVGTRLKLGPVSPTPQVEDLAPGELRVAPGAVYVGTGSHAVSLGEVQPQGRAAMPADAWARGQRPAAGARLGSG